jgi:hypothetical protein
MREPQKSQFKAYFQPDATPRNRKPSMMGSITLPTGQSYELSLWDGTGKKGSYF